MMRCALFAAGLCIGRRIFARSAMVPLLSIGSAAGSASGPPGAAVAALTTSAPPGIETGTDSAKMSSRMPEGSSSGRIDLKSVDGFLDEFAHVFEGGALRHRIGE